MIIVIKDVKALLLKQANGDLKLDHERSWKKGFIGQIMR